MRTFLRAGLLVAGACALLLLVAWLAEWPPFGTPTDGSVTRLEADAVRLPPPPAPPPAPAAGERPPRAAESTPPPAPEPPPGPPPVRIPPDVTVPPPAESVDFHTDAQPFGGKQVMVATDKAIAWLRKKQARDGSWGSVQAQQAQDRESYGADRGGYPAGPTALALYALLAARQPLKDPAVKRAFAWLHETVEQPASAPETSMLLLAVVATAEGDGAARRADGRRRPPKLTGRFRSWASRLADRLVALREARGWRYNDVARPTLAGGAEDLSSTQLAALALLSASRVGIRVKPGVWEDVLAFTRAQQAEDGTAVAWTDPVDTTQTRSGTARGFTYVRRIDVPDQGRATGSMTACGIANLALARDALQADGAGPEAWAERDDAPAVAAGIAAGLAWLAHHWSPFATPGKAGVQDDPYYWLWMLACAADLTGSQHVGSHAWYAEVGQQLLERQHPDGHWDGQGTWRPSDTLDTAFAVLILRRAARGLVQDR